MTVLTRAAERLLNRFLTVVETAPVAIVIVDSDGAVQVWNDGAERLFGWSDAEMRGRVYPDALTAAVETDEQFHARLRDGEQLHGVETQHTHADGGRRDVRVWAAPIQTQADDFDGGVFVVSDITEQKRREQRLSVLNRVLRHNIRTDVTVIRGHLDNAVEHNDSDTPRVDIEATVTTESESAGRHVVVRVADNGPGLPPMERRVLASEVETQLDHSSGLGLWLTRWIVQSSDGSISVLDSDFGGTCVAVRLRAVSE